MTLNPPLGEPSDFYFDVAAGSGSAIERENWSFADIPVGNEVFFYAVINNRVSTPICARRSLIGLLKHLRYLCCKPLARGPARRS